MYCYNLRYDGITISIGTPYNSSVESSKIKVVVVKVRKRLLSLAERSAVRLWPRGHIPRWAGHGFQLLTEPTPEPNCAKFLRRSLHFRCSKMRGPGDCGPLCFASYLAQLGSAFALPGGALPPNPCRPFGGLKRAVRPFVRARPPRGPRAGARALLRPERPPHRFAALNPACVC